MAKSTITAAQCRAARALLDWSQRKLAKRSGSGITTLHYLERESTRGVSGEMLKAIRTTLEDAGVIFINDSGGGPGVRLKPRYTAAGFAKGRCDMVRVAVALIALLLLSSAAKAQKRVALVVGINKYDHLPLDRQLRNLLIIAVPFTPPRSCRRRGSCFLPSPYFYS